MNVTRLINADDIPYAVNIDHPSGEYDYAYRCEVDAMHTVDAVPVVHGRWKSVSIGRYACSVCGCEPWYGGSIRTLNYCPNCGADMRGEQDG